MRVAFAASRTPARSTMRQLELAYRSHRRALVRLARSHVRPPSTPDDVVQDVFLSLVARVRAGAFDESRPIYPYLKVAVRNRARSARFRDLVVEPDLKPQGQKPSAVTRVAVREAWQELTAAERLAIAKLHILEEDVSRLDRNVYASRIRVARKRLGA